MKNKHTLIMIICCVLPVAGFGIAYLLGVPLGTLGTVALLLLCPLGHIIMMRSMGKEHAKHDHGGKTSVDKEVIKGGYNERN